jgi:hypothetical protein
MFLMVTVTLTIVDNMQVAGSKPRLPKSLVDKIAPCTRESGKELASHMATDDSEKPTALDNHPGVVDNAATREAKDKDIAIEIVGEHRHDLDPAAEARVVRKIDLFLVPAMTIGYGLVYYDKV